MNYVRSDSDSYVTYHNQSAFGFGDYAFLIRSAMGATAFYIKTKVGKIGKPIMIKLPENYYSERYGSTDLPL